MKKPLLVIFACWFTLQCIAQQAPDFTVTDASGNQHKLYEDYLDQERTVLIKVFFTTCPPCRSIASSMEIYYQEWGAGTGDVEFIELSNKSFDDDTRINNYKAEFGITFPSVGSDGGSLEALGPYQDGTYGPFTGTPLFVVIGPDGEVNFDVDGPNRWEALDEALYATGALKPGEDTTDNPTPDPDPVIIEGFVRSAQPGLNPLIAGIEGVEVFVIDENGVEYGRDTTSSSTGRYEIKLDSADVADNVLYVDVEKFQNPTNGVSASDLVAIQKHLLGLESLQETTMLFASDANLNQSISATDLLFLKRLLLELEPHFSDGKSWEFFHADLNLGPAGEQPPVLNRSPIPISDIMDEVKSPDFIGIKRGDVNWSADQSR